MKKKDPCARCVWNNAPLCGRIFCILPRCIKKGKELKKSDAGKKESRDGR
ncbi:MAG: hypothetical protein VB092_06690 [Oscillospiraceae bacterium]|nr:hypothetical protein [Oscillospiraceae bacterium]